MENLLSLQEENILSIIQSNWDEKKEKLSVSDLVKLLEEKPETKLSYERLRQIVESLWEKGEILIDVKGNERLIRPNHVTVNSRSHPTSFRNLTIVDKNTGQPTQRIWFSAYEKDGEKYLVISESRYNGSWKTTSNIIIPPEAMSEGFGGLLEFAKGLTKSN